MVDHLDEIAWLEPQTASGSGQGPLGAEQVEQWRTTGACLVDGLLPDHLVEQVRSDADAHYPVADSPEAGEIRDFGSVNGFVFPSRSDALNEVTLHPRILGACAQLLGLEVGQLRLTQSDLWVKYGRTGPAVDRYDNADQRIHVDYPNHNLAHPTEWHAPEAVEIIVYYDDVATAGGGTAVVPRTGDDDPAYAWPIVANPGVGDLTWINDRASAEAWLAENAPDVATFRADVLYPRERYARYRPGSVLLYRHDTWHRGTPLLAGSRRIAQNLTFRREGADWISVLHPGWAWAMYRADQKMEIIIGTSTPEQRSVLGFPAPGHSYWTPATLAGVTARYLAWGFDPEPYAGALAVRS